VVRKLAALYAPRGRLREAESLGATKREAFPERVVFDSDFSSKIWLLLQPLQQ